MTPKRPILVSKCEMDHQKPTILLNFGTLSLGGCWGHPMRQKLNLKDKCQISKPNEYTDNFKFNLHISLCQGQIKKNTLPSDTVYKTWHGQREGISLHLSFGSELRETCVLRISPNTGNSRFKEFPFFEIDLDNKIWHANHYKIELFA